MAVPYHHRPWFRGPGANLFEGTAENHTRQFAKNLSMREAMGAGVFVSAADLSLVRTNVTKNDAVAPACGPAVVVPQVDKGMSVPKECVMEENGVLTRHQQRYTGWHKPLCVWIATCPVGTRARLEFLRWPQHADHRYGMLKIKVWKPNTLLSLWELDDSAAGSVPAKHAEHEGGSRLPIN